MDKAPLARAGARHALDMWDAHGDTGVASAAQKWQHISEASARKTI